MIAFYSSLFFQTAVGRHRINRNIEFLQDLSSFPEYNLHAYLLETTFLWVVFGPLTEALNYELSKILLIVNSEKCKPPENSLDF